MSKKPDLLGLVSSGLKDLGFPSFDEGRYNVARHQLGEGEFEKAFDSTKEILAWDSDRSSEHLLEYINEFDLEDPEVMSVLTDYARAISSDEMTAVMGEPMPTAWDNILFGNIGPYYGQNISLMRNEPEPYAEGLKDPVNLRDVFFGYLTPEEIGFEETSLRPSQGYPFQGDKIYNIEPYINLVSLFDTKAECVSGADGCISTVEDEIMHLKENEGFRIEEPDFATTLDLGNTNWSIGKDENGRLYAAVADVWDFGGGALRGYGKLMDIVGKNPINMYGRFYFDEKDYFNLPMDSMGPYSEQYNE